MDSSSITITILQLTLIIMITGVVFWGVADWARQRKMQPVIEQERALRLQAEVKRQEESQVASEKQDLMQRRIDEAAERQAHLDRTLVELQDRLTRESAQATSRMAELDLELKTAQHAQRDTDSQLAQSKSRVSDLEAALDAEKGRISAMQEALEAKQDLAKQLAQELSTARNSFTDERRAATEREAALRAQLADHEKMAASGQSMADVINAELEKTRVAQAELEKESSSRLSELQRKLAAAVKRHHKRMRSQTLPPKLY